MTKKFVANGRMKIPSCRNIKVYPSRNPGIFRIASG